MEGMQFIKELGITEFGVIQYFDAADKVPDNIIGTIASMILSNQDTDTSKTLFGFVLTEDGDSLKVSARATRALVKRGLNLSQVMKQVAEHIGNGSAGGGHDIAAGATIPIDKKQKFLELAEGIIREQLRD